ncbi:MAG: type 1 glutamine amidotransferase [Bdellovibrio sp.]
MSTARPLLIGLSPRILYETPEGFEIKRKTIQYLEESLAHLVGKHGGLIFMVPSLESSSLLEKSDLNVHHYAEVLDGLVLQGGVDISPSMYGEEPIDIMTSHRTDPIRDRYELKLLKAFVLKKKPVLGICRGFQLMNVFRGGTLFQDLPTQRTSAVFHYQQELYDKATHMVEVQKGGVFENIYPAQGEIVSIHHQGVKNLGADLKVEATSEDGLIEAFSSTDGSFFVGVQWHPEFHLDDEERFLRSEPLMKIFMQACADRNARRDPNPLLSVL